MLVLITGLHVLHGPQPSLIKTLIRGEEVSAKTITRWVSRNNNKDFIRCPRAIKRGARCPSISKHSEQKEAVNYAGNYLSNYGSFVIRFRNVPSSRQTLYVASIGLTLYWLGCDARSGMLPNHGRDQRRRPGAPRFCREVPPESVTNKQRCGRFPDLGLFYMFSFCFCFFLTLPVRVWQLQWAFFKSTEEVNLCHSLATSFPASLRLPVPRRVSASKRATSIMHRRDMCCRIAY